ncbi:MAG: GGDEF domain-containing protein [Oscillospiraceae bacterium]|nr:GGDEF domain-containing protein [Oscillospiraceae bacterium]
MEDLMLKDRVDRAVKEYRNDNVRLLKELKKLLKEAEKTGDVNIVGRLSMLLSGCYFDLGNRDKILPHAVKAVSIYEKTDDVTRLARSYNLLGIAHLAQGNYQLAISFYNKALETIRGRRKPGIGRDVMLNNIAECYYQMGEYQKSIRLMKGCLSAVRVKRPSDHSSTVIYGINLSDCYESMEDYKKSIAILDEVKSDADQLAQDPLLWAYYARRCCVLYKSGRLVEAEKYADLTIDAVNAGYDSYELHRDFEKIATMQVKAGDYKRAQNIADILTKYADENGHTLDLIISKRVQADICYGRGEYERSLELYRALNGLYKQRITEENAMQYESQKNAENAAREIARLMKRVRDSEEKAERDPLTGLMNRSALVNVSNDFMENARANGKTLGGIFLDIDYFKEFNDTYGHAAGDDAIKYIADVCLSEETPTVKFFRYGGDEYFGFVLDHRDDEIEELALRIAEKIRSSGFEHLKNPNGQRLTVSIGVVNVDMRESEDNIMDLIKFADKALYHAKDRGKDDVFAYHRLGNSEYEYRRITGK